MMELGKIAEQAAVTAQTAPKTTTQTVAEKTNSTLAADNADKYVKSGDGYTPAYTKQAAQKSNVENSGNEYALSVAKTKSEHLTGVVENMIAHQAQKNNPNAKNQLTGALKEQFNEILGIKTEDKKDDEDYWGVDATAQRIFDFAKNLAGDNDELAETLRGAVQKGFKLAGRSFGQKLPEICDKTYDKIMSMFDEWIKAAAENKTEDKKEETADKVDASSQSEASAQ